MNKKIDRKQFSWQGSVSSEGTLGLNLYFPDTSGMTKQAKEKLLASVLADSYEFMMSRGYLPPEARFMSSSDLAEEYGKSRQYWEKLLNEDKIPYRETSAGRITTDLWVQGYLNNKDKVDEYVRNRNKVVRVILEQERKYGCVECPNCGKPQFDYAVNASSTNGICRAGCGFRINTTL